MAASPVKSSKKGVDRHESAVGRAIIRRINDTTSGMTPAAPADLDCVTGWHAHIYYDPAATRSQAERLRAQLAGRFPRLQIGRWHDSPVGPHTRAMFQILFAPDDFAAVVPFLAFARGGLSILVHADGTDDGRKAHIEQAIWMGEPLPLTFRPRA